MTRSRENNKTVAVRARLPNMIGSSMDVQVQGNASYVSMAAVIAAASIFGLTYSLTAPLIALQLSQKGYGEYYIGLNAAMHAAGVLLIAPILPSLAVRFGARTLIVVALITTASLLALFPLVPAVWIWFPLRLGFGMGAEVLFVMSETWTNELSNDRVRGRTMALYTASLSLGMVGGPALLSVLGARPLAYWVGAAIAVTAVVLVAGPWVTEPVRIESPSHNPLKYLRLAPIAVATTVLNAAIETAGLSFIALYATGMGWSEQGAMRLISTLMLGAILLQLPIGWLADRMNPRRLALILAALSAVSALFWPWMLGQQWLAYTMIFVWGGLFVGIYTVMLTMVGSHYSGSDLVGIYAVMGLAWGGGALLGPSLAGVAMSVNPHYGLPTFVAIACALFAAYMLVSRSKT
jgi:MFS family permease